MNLTCRVCGRQGDQYQFASYDFWSSNLYRVEPTCHVCARWANDTRLAIMIDRLDSVDTYTDMD